MAKKKTALITGITGQDGAYLTEFLLKKGYLVYGLVRRSSSFNTARIDYLYQDPHEKNVRLRLVYGDLNDASSLNRIIKTIKPGEIYLGRTSSHHHNFLNAVKTRRQPMAPAQVGHRSITICHLINIAMLTGQKLKWDPDREQITNSEKANRMLYRPMRSPWHL